MTQRGKTRARVCDAIGITVLVLSHGCGGGSAPPATPVTDPAPAAEGEPADTETELVQLSLIADTRRAAPGQEITLAARLAIAPGWHVYWTNPGEAGLATEVRFTGPDGYDIGPPRFPGPERFESPGLIESYGYAGQVLVSAVVTPPPSSASRTDAARFTVEAEWLACKDACVRGTGTATLEVPPASPVQPAEPLHADLFAAHEAAIPRPFGELAGAAAAWSTEGRDLVISVPGAEQLGLFPKRDAQLAISGTALVPRDGFVELRVGWRSRTQAAAVRGVLSVTRGGAVSYYDIDVAVPAADASAADPSSGKDS